MAADATAADLPGEAALVKTTPANGHKRALSQAELRQRGEAALKHGLYARSPEGKRRRQYRAGRLLARLQDAFADAGRPLSEIEIPGARAWAQLETLATDAYAAIQAGDGGEKAIHLLLAIRRQQLPYAQALGMTPSSAAGLGKELAAAYREKQAAENDALWRRYAPSTSPYTDEQGLMPSSEKVTFSSSQSVDGPVQIAALSGESDA